MDIYLVLIFFLWCMLLTQIERYYHGSYLKWLFIVPFCLLVANRDLIVPDTDVYLDYFNSINVFINDFESYTFEIGFQVFSKFIMLIVGNNFFLYLGCIALINILLISYSLNRIEKLFKTEQENKNTNNAFTGRKRILRNATFSIMPLTLYAAFYGIYVNAIVLRVGIAFSLLVLASSFALKKEKKIFDYVIIFLLLIAGYVFHSTALLGIIVILIMLSNIRFSKKTYLLICFFIGSFYFSSFFNRLGEAAFSSLASLTLNEFTLVTPRLYEYVGNMILGAEAISIKFCFLLIMAVILTSLKIQSDIYFKLLNVYLIGLVIAALFRSVLLIDRVTDYFLLFSFVIFYLFLIKQSKQMFWLHYVPIIIVQLIFVLRITKTLSF